MHNNELPKQTQKFENKDDWYDETIVRQEAIKKFLQNYLSTSLKDRKGLSDLHFSGGNIEVMQKTREGTGKIEEIKVLYKNNRPDQIHIVLSSDGKWPLLDVYLTGDALNDYLAFIEQK